ncbi:type I-E CRISPR-associated endoribonuclease Cas2 [Desulfonema ishimotonii]|uniref:Type I-E CRISPR-associated endoribonuclease Cas2 n=2 Tax=Desulfonema ishimotonii TaxID=45657 RepID=A0A401FWS2_9BACT|nr:type I-E CRISPR-associated endoribonuclease Cas2 [Desulfonema ishimotonii]
MVVVEVENAPDKLRGTLTAWFLQVRAGLYVGTLSARMRDQIWVMITGVRDDLFSAVMVFPKNNEQGFGMRTFGKNRRKVVNVDGLELIEYIPHFERENAEFAEGVIGKKEP